MEEYSSKEEFCKLTNLIPLDILNSHCKNVDRNKNVNESYFYQFITYISLYVIAFFIFIYIFFIYKNTSYLRSETSIIIISFICICISIYSFLFSYMELGKIGPKGKKGPKGLTGNSGPKGKVGPQGFQGRVGDVGLQGQTGPMGESGLIGNRGEKGERGNRGERGTKGLKGFTGNQGDMGITGIPGSNGQKGPVGDKGDDNILVFKAANDGDSSIANQVFTYNSEIQDTVWKNSYKYYDVHNEISNMLKCDTNRASEYDNMTYNSCKELCTTELDENGYMNCVGIYGDLDLENPDVIIENGKCFICPERIYDNEYFQSTIDNVRQSANSNPTYSYKNFVTGIKLKTIKNTDQETDAAHAYLTNFFVENIK